MLSHDPLVSNKYKDVASSIGKEAVALLLSLGFNALFLLLIVVLTVALILALRRNRRTLVGNQHLADHSTGATGFELNKSAQPLQTACRPVPFAFDCSDCVDEVEANESNALRLQPTDGARVYSGILLF